MFPQFPPWFPSPHLGCPLFYVSPQNLWHSGAKLPVISLHVHWGLPCCILLVTAENETQLRKTYDCPYYQTMFTSSFFPTYFYSYSFSLTDEGLDNPGESLPLFIGNKSSLRNAWLYKKSPCITEWGTLGIVSQRPYLL